MRKAFTLIELLVACAIAFILFLIFVMPFTGIRFEYSTGDRAGQVYKLSKKGFIWKTWEGELNLGGMTTNSEGVAVPNAWQFSVVDEAVIAKLKEASITGKRAVLHYTEYFNQPPWKGSTRYEITAVELDTGNTRLER